MNQRWTEGNTRQGLVRGALCADDRTDSDAGKFASRKKEKREDVGGENTPSLIIIIVRQYLLEADWDNFLIRLIKDFWSLSGRADRIPTKPWWLQTPWLEAQVLKMSCLIVDSSGWICENEAFLRDVLRHCAVLFHRVRVPPKLRSCRSSFKVDPNFQQNSLTSVGETEVGGSCEGPVELFFFWGGKETLTGRITRYGIGVYSIPTCISEMKIFYYIQTRFDSC